MKIKYTPTFSSRYLKLDASNDPITGDLLLKPTSNSTTTFGVQQSDGTQVFNVDTTNNNFHIDGDITNYNSNLEDIGKEQKSDKRGYGSDYISDKRISNSLIGSNSRAEEGAIGLNSGTFQIYANGVWNDVVINFRLREDSSGAYEFEHKPIGFSLWYEIMSGNSDTLGIDGKPIVQQYTSSMGAYQPDVQISGGSF